MSRPWMPLYVGDFIQDTTHMNATEIGAYMLLIMSYWTNGSLPDNEAQLARIARLSKHQWDRVRPVLSEKFFDGWKHKRVERELAKAIDISSKRSAIAQQKHSNSRAIAQQEQTQPQSHKKEDAAATPPSDEKSYFDRGKKLGLSGGYLAKLLNAKGRDVALARATIEIASTKENPGEYVGAIIRNAVTAKQAAENVGNPLIHKMTHEQSVDSFIKSGTWSRFSSVPDPSLIPAEIWASRGYGPDGRKLEHH